MPNESSGPWVMGEPTTRRAEHKCVDGAMKYFRADICVACLTARLAAAEAAMKAAASLPGRLWLTGQLAIAEFLSGEGGEHLSYALEQYEAAKAGVASE